MKYTSGNIPDSGSVSTVDIETAQRLICEYEWQTEEKTKLLTMIDAIREQQRNKKLNVSVVGEFSTGKSTFINAIFKHEIMSAQCLQGTTVAATVIEKDNVYRMQIRYMNGEVKKYYFMSFSELQEMLVSLSTETDDAIEIYSIHVGLPLNSFIPALRVVDTPGINVEKQWHEEVTVRAIEKMSDAVIILVDATQAMPVTLMDFIRLHMEDMLSRCIFIVTKMDCVQEKERADILAYVRVRVQQEFEIEDPIVLPYSPLEVLSDNGIIPESAVESTPDAELLAMSYQTEQTLYRILEQQQKTEWQSRMVHLVDELYENLLRCLESRADAVKFQLSQESDHVQIPPVIFIEEQKRQRTESYKKAARKLAQKTAQTLSAMADNVKLRILQTIQYATTDDMAAAFLMLELRNVCAAEIVHMSNYGNNVLEELFAYFTAEMYRFRTEFSELYGICANIPAVGMNMPYHCQLRMPDIGKAAAEVVKLSNIGRKKGFSAWNNISPEMMQQRKNNAAALMQAHLDSYFSSAVIQVLNRIDFCVRVREKEIQKTLSRYAAGFPRTAGAVSSDSLRLRQIQQEKANLNRDIQLVQAILHK